MMPKVAYTYDPIFVISDGPNKEVHFSKRSDGQLIISRCSVLRDGQKSFMRSSIVMNQDVAKEFCEKLGRYLKDK